MSELLQGWKRTCYCTELSKADVGREVTLMGWCNVRRDLGALIFVQLRDRSGLMQVVFDSSTLSVADYERASTIRSEYVLAVRGILEERTGNMVNPKMKTGEVEVKVRTSRSCPSARRRPSRSATTPTPGNCCGSNTGIWTFAGPSCSRI